MVPKVLFLLFLIPINGYTQNWAGIIDTTRAMDWSNAGVVGGIPSAAWSNCTASACNTLYGGTVTATTIGNALAVCGTNEVVRIPAGTYSVAEFNFTKSNCVLRGAGGSSTILTMTGNQSGAGMGGTLSATIHLMSGTTAHNLGSGINTATWTASNYNQGQTTITLSSTTGITAGAIGTGTLIFLDQLDDASDGYPAAGDLYICDTDTANCSNKADSNHWGRSGRSMVQAVTVTALNGSVATISPGLYMPNWRSAKTPGAWWVPTTAPIHNSGIENLTIDFTDVGAVGVLYANAVNCWLKGVRVIDNGDHSVDYHVMVFQAAHLTLQSNYIYGPGSTSSETEIYAMTFKQTSDLLVENNILHHNRAAIVSSDPGIGNVFAYNNFEGGYGNAISLIPHAQEYMNLYEGNAFKNFYADVTHSPHFFLTLFRNHGDGLTRNEAGNTNMPLGLLTNNRFFNIIGNVIGYTDYTTYERSSNLGNLSGQSSDSIYTLGWHGDNSGTLLTDDDNVKRTLFRWGNWDKVTNAVRWCGNSGNTGWSTTCSSTTEVPSGITNYSTAIPSTETLPASFYLSGQPLWWTTAYGTPAYPAIGPDVTGGGLSNAGGHANKIPARLCFDNASNDAAYPSSSPRIKIFNADTCYTSAGSAVVSTILMLPLFFLIILAILISFSPTTIPQLAAVHQSQQVTQ